MSGEVPGPQRSKVPVGEDTNHGRTAAAMCWKRQEVVRLDSHVTGVVWFAGSCVRVVVADP